MNSNTNLRYRDGLAFIGRKGASPGKVRQLHSKMHTNARAHLTGCISNYIFIYLKKILVY